MEGRGRFFSMPSAPAEGEAAAARPGGAVTRLFRKALESGEGGAEAEAEAVGTGGERQACLGPAEGEGAGEGAGAGAGAGAVRLLPWLPLEQARAMVAAVGELERAKAAALARQMALAPEERSAGGGAQPQRGGKWHFDGVEWFEGKERGTRRHWRAYRYHRKGKQRLLEPECTVLMGLCRGCKLGMCLNLTEAEDEGGAEEE
jgi:hypothetical protein